MEKSRAALKKSQKEIKQEPLFPSTRYQGSKSKLADWIWETIKNLEFKTCLDLFGGTGAIAYQLKRAGKKITYNDILCFNYYMGVALIENNHITLSQSEVDWLLERHPEVEYPHFIQDTFQDIYFTSEENQWIDQTISNIRQLQNPYKFALAFFALCQACLIKRPYNLFHRKNLYLRLAEVKRHFGNKTTWDKPFDPLFRSFIKEVNGAIFDNHQVNSASNLDAFQMKGSYDLVYIDTPYISNKGVALDYFQFYHFLEGLTSYDNWAHRIDYDSKHYRLRPQKSDWTDRKQIYFAFDHLFQKYQESLLVVSYRSDGIPTESELVALLKQYKKTVQIHYFGPYHYALSKNTKSKEILLIGT